MKVILGTRFPPSFLFTHRSKHFFKTPVTTQMSSMSKTTRFLQAQLQAARQAGLCDDLELAYSIFCDLLLQPDLPLWTRANAHLIIAASDAKQDYEACVAAAMKAVKAMEELHSDAENPDPKVAALKAHIEEFYSLEHTGRSDSESGHEVSASSSTNPDIAVSPKLDKLETSSSTLPKTPAPSQRQSLATATPVGLSLPQRKSRRQGCCSRMLV